MSSGGTPKKVLYLFGAGATQAEADHKARFPINLLMTDINDRKGVSSRALDRSGIRKELDLEEEEKKVDIEKLISLLTASGVQGNIEKAEKLRRAYYEEIMESLQNTDILETPELAISLLEMHNNEKFKEKEVLSGIISLNHDNLYQVASQTVHGCVNLGFNFTCPTGRFDDALEEEDHDAPLLIQLHGSFNWRNSHPITVKDLSGAGSDDEEMLWIPPTTSKEAKDYPFNKLMALSYEKLTDCDILRVVGCSLSQNDWNLLALLFRAQNRKAEMKQDYFEVQIIDRQIKGNEIKDSCSYLQKIVEIGRLTDGIFDDYKDNYQEEDPPESSVLSNPLKYWLKTKANYHTNEGVLILDEKTRILETIM